MVIRFPRLIVNGQPVNRYDGSSPEVRWIFSTTPSYHLSASASDTALFNIALGPLPRPGTITIRTKTTTETNYRRELVSEYLSSSSLGGEQYRIGYIGIGDGEDYMIPVTDADTFGFEGKWEIKGGEKEP